jgi:hypothetical protein
MREVTFGRCCSGWRTCPDDDQREITQGKLAPMAVNKGFFITESDTSPSK